MTEMTLKAFEDELEKIAEAFQGIPIHIEKKKGSVKRGRNRYGESWKRVSTFDYGNIPGTLGNDREALDVYLGPSKRARYAYVFHQLSPRKDDYDEDKIMLGFRGMRQARKAFRENSMDPDMEGAVTRIPVSKLRKAVEQGGHVWLMDRRAEKKLRRRFG